LLSQEVELNCHVEVSDHVHVKVKFQKRDNLPKYQCASQNSDFGQVQMSVWKFIHGFQNNSGLDR